MILWNNIIFVIFTDRRAMHQAFIDPTTMTSDPATLRYTAAVKCNYACATQKTEKNWAPFLIGNKLYAIYRHTPSFVVIKFNGTLWSTVYNVDAMSMFKHWQFGEIRGGTPPVWHNNEFYSFFHSSMHYTPKQRGIRQYYVGCYTFDQNFKILRLTHRPIMFGLPGRRIDCVFPCGAICKDNKWYISYGYQDAEVRVAVIDCYEIDQLLQYHETDII